MVTNFAFLKIPISYEMVAKTKNSLPTGELCELSCRLLIFFSKISFRNTIRMSTSLDPDQTRRFSGKIWVLTVCSRVNH